MSCPRCWAVVPAGGPCPTCAPLASIQGKIEGRRFSGNPAGRWAGIGWRGGMALGVMVGVLFEVFLGPGWYPTNPVWPGFYRIAAFALLGALLGAALVILY